MRSFAALNEAKDASVEDDIQVRWPRRQVQLGDAERKQQRRQLVGGDRLRNTIRRAREMIQKTAGRTVRRMYGAEKAWGRVE